MNLQLLEEERTADKYDLSVMFDGEKIGQLLLCRKKAGDKFSIDNMSVKPEKRSARLIGHVLIEGLKKARQEYGVASIEMYKGYPEPHEANDDPWLKVSRSVIGLNVERREVERCILAKMEPTARQNHERLYKDDRLEREGFTFLNWFECGDDTDRQIERLRAEAGERYLPTDFPKRAEDFTVIGLYRGEVCSWLILNRLSEVEVDCNGWYAVKKFRRVSSGMRLFMHAFREIDKRLLIRWYVRPEDEAPMRFYLTFFKDALENVEYAYKYYWSLNERR